MTLKFGIFSLWMATWLCAAAAGAAASGATSTLETVRKRGVLLCGVSKAAPGFSQIGEGGKWSGLEIDFCAALSAAALGRSDAVKFIPLDPAGRFTALQSGGVDVLAHNTSWTLGRDTELGLRFVAPLYHQGTALLVRKSQGVASALELSGSDFCLLAASPTQRNVAAFFGARKMRYEIVAFDKWNDAVKAFVQKRCNVLAGNAKALFSHRVTTVGALQHMILPERIAQQPLGPAVRKGDEQWFDIVRWTLFAMIGAEELGLSRDNVDVKRAAGIPAIRQFLDVDGKFGKTLGLSGNWTYRIVKQVGNYGESFARHLGDGSPIKMKRGLNRLWSKGGLLTAPPFR